MKPASFRKAVLIFASATLAVASLAFGFAKARSLLSKAGASGNAMRPKQMPQVVLWAWERPTDLRFIDPDKIGVAFLARTIRLKTGEVIIRRRLQSLNLPEGAKVIAVVRIESDRMNRLSDQQCDSAAAAIAELASPGNVSDIQIDFDATQSQRNFYRGLIFEVRRRLPANVGLSITALTSWCTYDDWLSDLPIDEAVPMLFRMAGDGKQIANSLNSGEDFNVPLCRQSYGISLDEQRPRLFPSRRLYVFNPDAWTEDSVRGILELTK